MQIWKPTILSLGLLVGIAFGLEHAASCTNPQLMVTNLGPWVNCPVPLCREQYSQTERVSCSTCHASKIENSRPGCTDHWTLVGTFKKGVGLYCRRKL
ncbi:hypothetical protein PGTUg99_034117 [Puccinia graminis f. sp. tritici]|uniref:Uncharacterized protein n=1 Tax=Puccinia graminis f. sp. tritici TaxID=56615 RepID=A0A5B0SLC4_PUCGR|nr:hypothetical protein PGTUg99_034117 [Puccinia graminis f. sp. tritici]